MASQVSVELELADFVDCVCMEQQYNNSTTDRYTISNLFMVLELVEFDQSFDQAFLAGLMGDGV